MRSLAKIPEISKQIVDELDNDNKEFAGVQMALAAYETKLSLQRMTDDYNRRLNKTKKSWKDELASSKH